MKSRYFKPALFVMIMVAGQMIGFLWEPKSPGASANTPNQCCAVSVETNYTDSFNNEMEKLRANVNYIVTNR
jgi:hypothetical protein